MEVLSVFIYIKDLIATLLILLAMISPAFGGNGTAYKAEEPEKLVMSFSAVSDTHIETNNPHTYKAFYDILEGVKAGKNHEAVVYLGDNVMNGQFLENVFFYAGVRAVMPSENNFVLMGNHDIGNGTGKFNEHYNNFLANNNFYLSQNLDKNYYYRVVNGCYMIFLASEDLTVNNCIISEEQLLWLEGVLDEAAAADAATFVFNHHPIYQLEGVEYDALAGLLSTYDNLIYIYGHTHDELGVESFKEEDGVNTINLPRSTEIVEYEPGDGIVVEVYEDEILVRGRNFIEGEWVEGLEFRYPLG